MILFATALIALNLIYIYANTRPNKPILVFDFGGNLTSAIWNNVGEVRNAIHLRADGRWSLQNGQIVNPVNVTDLTIPNIDSPSYWVLVNSDSFPSSAEVVKAIQSLANLGVCNSVIMNSASSTKNGEHEESVLTLDYYSDGTGKALKKCQTSAVIEQRYDKANVEYERTKKRAAILEW
jgi:hypothetical protein